MLTRSSKRRKVCDGFFNPKLEKCGAKQLLTAVLHGDEEKVLNFAKKNPEWFFIKIKEKVKDYAMDLEGNCRELEGWSAYQAIFGTVDKDMLWDAKNNKPTEIKRILDEYLNILPDGHQLAYDQEQEKFPNGFNYPESTYDFKPLVDAITNDQSLIDNDNPSEATLAVLAAFRADFKPGVVKTGYHFNMNDFVKAHDVYGQNWEPNQQAFFSKYVIGFLERLVSAPYMQRACQGIANREQPLKRSYDVRNNEMNKIIAVFPLDSHPYWRLGKNFFVNSYGGRGGMDLTWVRPHPSHWEKLCQANTAKLSKLAHTKPRAEPTRVNQKR